MTRIRRSLVVCLALQYAAKASAVVDTCFNGRCSDSPTYVSIMGLGCAGHGFFDCALFIDMGFTRQQVDELIESCPCSCAVECPNEPASLSPTIRPSPSPVSLTPTNAPTARPSSAPVSPSPTKRPSSAPITTQPTFMPSQAPRSSSPTFLPTAAPVSPTSSPVKMSTTTRIRPSQISREGTCPTGFSGLTPTPDCKGAIHCSNGVKIFGPIPCLTGPTGSLVFDYNKKLCVLKTDDFVCEHPEDLVPDMVETVMPTQAPNTDAPTVFPSRSPTKSSSEAPVSSSPTSRPSRAPVSSSPASRPSRAPVSSIPTARPSQAPVSSIPTARPSRAPVSSKPTLLPISSPIRMTPTFQTPDNVGEPSPSFGTATLGPNNAVSAFPTTSRTDSEMVTDLTRPRNDDKAEEMPDEQIVPDKEPTFEPRERSFWNTSISPSSETTKMFTPLVIGIIAGVGILIIVVAAAMFSLGKRMRMRKKRNGEPDVNLKPGDKIQIDNMDEVVLGPEKEEEDEGIAGQILSAIFGSGVNENATMGPDGAGSTIITGVSMQSASSKMNSILESSKASTQKVMESIETARQKSFESTTEQVQKIKKEVQKVAEDPAKAVQDATDITAQDINNCGDRIFNCASSMLCLPNDVQPRTRRRNGGSSTKRQKNLRESFFDPDEDLSEMSSVYEDV